MYKVINKTNKATQGHSVVFANSSSVGDMTQVIGRFNKDDNSIVFLKDNGAGTKFEALFDNGFMIQLKPTRNDSYYVSEVSDKELNESAYIKECLFESEVTFNGVAFNDGEYFLYPTLDAYEVGGPDNAVGFVEIKDGNADVYVEKTFRTPSALKVLVEPAKATRQAAFIIDWSINESEVNFEYVDEQEFLDNHNDSAIDIVFTTPDMAHEHRVGLMNYQTGKYTLRDDLKELLDEFDIEDEINKLNEPYGRIDNASVNARGLRKVIEILKKEDGDDLTESIGRDTVYAPALKQVKGLLRALGTAAKNSNPNEFKQALSELDKLIKELKATNAEGLEEIEKERKAIIASRNAINEAAYILEQSGVQIKGQQQYCAGGVL